MAAKLDPEVKRARVRARNVAYAEKTKYWRKRDKEKKAAYMKEWKAKNKEKVKANFKKWYEANGKRYNDDPEIKKRRVIYIARSRARLVGVPCTISVADLEWPTHCPALGVELDYAAKGHGRPNSPSIDRIIPARGYVPGNVMIISLRANVLKRDGTVDEIGRLADFLRSLPAPPEMPAPIVPQEVDADLAARRERLKKSKRISLRKWRDKLKLTGDYHKAAA
jgi:hypothetical protein